MRYSCQAGWVTCSSSARSGTMIVVTLPIEGTLSKPDVDIGPAVNKAIAGALQKVFPPTMVASMIAGLAIHFGPTRTIETLTT